LFSLSHSHRKLTISLKKKNKPNEITFKPQVIKKSPVDCSSEPGGACSEDFTDQNPV